MGEEVMTVVLLVIGTILYFLACLMGVLLLVIGLPGLWVIVGATLIYCLSTDQIPGTWVALYTALAIGAEIVEFGVGAYGAKKYGGTKWGMLGAVAGSILGAILLSVIPVVGTIVGAFLGAFLGAFALEYASDGDLRRARETGKGAFFGKIAAVVVKGGLAIAMIISSFIIIVFK